MSDINKEQLLINDNDINSIFERKIELGAVIQFNLLQRIIEEFIKRQKSLNDKVDNLEIKINSISETPLNPNLKEEIDEFKENINFEPNKETILKEKEDNDLNNINTDIDKVSEKDYLELDDDKKETEKNKEIKEIKEKKDTTESLDKKKENEINHNQYRILSSRFDKMEKTIKLLSNKVLNDSNEKLQKKEENKVDNQIINDQNEKINQLEKEIDGLHKKIKEINLIQVDFSNDIKENENEENKNKNAELLKIFTKKIEIVENRAKQTEEDIFKLKKDFTGINNSLIADKNNYNDFSKEINKNISDIKIMINKELNNLRNLMNEKDEIVKKELKDNHDNDILNIKKNIDELIKNMKNNNDGSNSNNLLNSKFNEKLNNLNNDLKNLINKSSSETEKYLKSIIINLGIENIKKEISEMQETIKSKLVRTDLDYIDLKIKEIENRIIAETLRLESMEKDVVACNDSCTKSVKMIEYLSGQVVQNNQQDIGQEKSELLKGLLTVNEKEIKSFVNKNEFSYEIKNIYKKIEQILEVESENYKFTQHIESRLKYFVTQNDLKTMERCLMNMFDELKNNFARKYMEKSEILKNFKFIEIQLKALYDSNPGMIKEGDNWLLAKKPMNNYLCASCEAYIGDLKTKNQYLAWNKIPMHENNKKYRMGNGFSRMLELVNTDLMKNAEKLNDNLIVKMDEKKNNFELHTPLPRLGSQVNLKKWNTRNNTYYVNNIIDKKLNNSADGLNNNSNSDLNNNKNSKNNINEYDTTGKSYNNVGESGISKILYDKDNSNPKVLKIVKKTKKDS